MNRARRPTIWMGWAYFAFYAGIACWGPYIVLYYRGLGFSGAEIGILNAIAPLGMALLAPVWGYVADARNAHRLLLRLILLATAAVALLLSRATSFWQVVPLVVVYALAGNTASPLLDSYGVTISAARSLSFGQLRVWGSIGYTLVVWLIGYAMGGTVSPLFLWCYALSLLLTCGATLGLPARRKHAQHAHWHHAAALLRRTDIRLVLMVAFLLAFGTNPVMSLFGIYVTALGGTTGLLGLASALAALSELPIMFFGNRLTKRLGSQRMFMIAIAVYALRILLFSLAPSASWVLAIQVLHGCSFGLYLIASVTLVHELVGPDFAATAQGLLASAMAFGQIMGAIVSGILLDQIGIFMIYRLSVGIIVLGLALFAVGQRWYMPGAPGAQPARADRFAAPPPVE